MNQNAQWNSEIYVLHVYLPNTVLLLASSRCTLILVKKNFMRISKFVTFTKLCMSEIV